MLEETLERIKALDVEGADRQDVAEKMVAGIHATIGHLTVGFSLTAPQGGPGVSVVLGAEYDVSCPKCQFDIPAGLVITADEARGLMGWLAEHVGSNKKENGGE